MNTAPDVWNLYTFLVALYMIDDNFKKWRVKTSIKSYFGPWQKDLDGYGVAYYVSKVENGIICGN